MRAGLWQGGPVFAAIKNGIAPHFNIGAFGEQLQDEDIWKLVHHIRSLAKK